MKNQKELHYKSPLSKDKRRATFVALENEKGNYDISMSICSEKDKFDKKRGYQIAKLRLSGTVRRPVLLNVDLSDKENKSSVQTMFNRTCKQLLDNDDIKTLMTPNLPEAKRKSWSDVSLRMTTVVSTEKKEKVEA